MEESNGPAETDTVETTIIPMRKPPTDPRFQLAPEQPTWSGVLVSYALLVGFTLFLFFLSRPLVGIVGLAAVVGLYVGAPRVSRLIRCVSHCRELTFDLAGEIQVTITQTRIDEPN